MRCTGDRSAREAPGREELTVIRQVMAVVVLLLHGKLNAQCLLFGFRKPGAFLECPFINEVMVEGEFYIQQESEAPGSSWSPYRKNEFCSN